MVLTIRGFTGQEVVLASERFLDTWSSHQHSSDTLLRNFMRSMGEVELIHIDWSRYI